MNIVDSECFGLVLHPVSFVRPWDTIQQTAHLHTPSMHQPVSYKLGPKPILINGVGVHQPQLAPCYGQAQNHSKFAHPVVECRSLVRTLFGEEKMAAVAGPLLMPE